MASRSTSGNVSEREKLYIEFKESYCKVHAGTKQQVVQNAQDEWNSMKVGRTDPEFVAEVNSKVALYRNKALEKRAKHDSFWAKFTSPKVSSKSGTAIKKTEEKPLPSTSIIKATPDPQQEPAISNRPEIKQRDTPAQDKVKKEIAVYESDITAIQTKLDSGLCVSPAKLYALKEEKKGALRNAKAKLRKLQENVARQDRFRAAQKRKIGELKEKFPEETVCLGRDAPGRPRLEETEPGLLEAIKKLATSGGAADNRRRSELIRSVKTLDDLKSALENEGYKLSKSAAYLRLIPRRSDSIEGKRHVVTVPVKLSKADTTAHKSHIDSRFASRTLFDLEEIASVIGPDEMTWLSCDDKCRVPIGLTAATKQSPLLMHMEYTVRLPDHDWVVAAGHKLIPSVYAGCVIEKGRFGDRAAVRYSGPTYIVIRSAKHDSSTAYSHLQDFRELQGIKEFSETMLQKDGRLKPVQIQSRDGGPDENPRYQKCLECAVSYFLENDLDAFIMATNAPGRSAYNRVERRMAPLSHDLAGVILPYDSYGSHLDKSGRTVDRDLEMKNFKKAGETLAEIWGETVIDGYPVVAAYKEKPQIAVSTTLKKMGHKWLAEHVRQAQYCAQIVKCTDTDCCKQFRSSWLQCVPDRFLPAPLMMKVRRLDFLILLISVIME